MTLMPTKLVPDAREAAGSVSGVWFSLITSNKLDKAGVQFGATAQEIMARQYNEISFRFLILKTM